MKILMVTSEARPYIMTSGLGEVAGKLPAAIKRLQHDVRVVLPKYSTTNFGRIRPLKVIDRFPVNLGGTTEYCSIYEGKGDDGVIFYWIENNKFFGREGIYGDKQGAYRDNHIRFALFVNGAIAVIKRKLFTPHIIHVHGWQSALLPIYLKNNFADEHISRIPVVLGLHDLSEQGIIEIKNSPDINIDPSLLTDDKLELNGKCNILKGGIVFSDHIATNSTSFAAEIQTPDYGMHLEGALKERKAKLTGVLNGIEYSLWDPEHDGLIPYSYTKESMSGKLLNKSNFIKKLGFEVDINLPLIGFVSKLVEEKGADILAQVIPDLAEENVLLVVHAGGDKIYEELMKDLAQRNPEKLKVSTGSDDEFIHQIYAASDMILMPSQFEPSASHQLAALRYGVVPIARAIGGLKDAVKEFSPKSGEGNGFLFQKYSALAFHRAVRRALDVYRTGRIWKELVKTCMSYDFSWDVSAQKYLSLFEKLLPSQ